MNDKRSEATKRYVLAVAQAHGGLDAVIAALEARDPGLEGVGIAEDGNEATHAFQELAMHREPGPVQLATMEAIIDELFRPAIDIQDGTYSTQHDAWLHLNKAPVKKRLERIFKSIGRVELPGHPKLPFGGTGFVVGVDLLMTNRHVAELFATGLGSRELRFLPSGRAAVDFVREWQRPAGQMLQVSSVVMIHPYWDMALLRVSGLTPEQAPLPLAVQPRANNHEIALVGYPAYDNRNPADVQNELFSQRFGFKRLLPGMLHGIVRVASFSKIVPGLGHDCSSLGGASGSPMVDLSNGDIVGLHFGGRYHDINYSVPSAALARDSRVVDAGVVFSGNPPGDPNEWRRWWQTADRNEAAEPDDDAAPPSRPPAPRAQTMRVGANSVTMEVPLRISISLGSAASSVDVDMRASADDTEAMREPYRDEDYDSREGYDPLFLGDELEVAMPTPVNPDALATTESGDSLLHYQNFSLAMHAKRRCALFAASNVTREAELRRPDPNETYTRRALSGLGENDQERWFLDPRIDASYQLPDIFFTKDRQAFDKGHLVRRDDVAWGETYDLLRRANGDTYHVTNCSPQVADFNRSALGEVNWGDLENLVLSQAASERLCVFAGPVLGRSDDVFLGRGDEGEILRVRIPSRYWKVVVATAGDELIAFGFVLEQDLSDVDWEFAVPDEFRPLQERISVIEAMAGIRFSDAIRDADQFDAEGATEMVMRGLWQRKGDPGES
jgi:endonuclease G